MTPAIQSLSNSVGEASFAEKFHPNSIMIPFAKIYFLIFSALLVAGGVLGYQLKGSMPSLIAGSISGILVFVFALRIGGGAAWPIWSASIVSLLLLGRFLPPTLKKGFQLPATDLPPLEAVSAWILVFPCPPCHSSAPSSGSSPHSV